jgi:septal ring factor EnvC (AmiA/AmiB activator)
MSDENDSYYRKKFLQSEQSNKAMQRQIAAKDKRIEELERAICPLKEKIHVARDTVLYSPKYRRAVNELESKDARIEELEKLLVIFLNIFRQRPDEDEWVEEFDEKQRGLLAKICDEQALKGESLPPTGGLNDR